MKKTTTAFFSASRDKLRTVLLASIKTVIIILISGCLVYFIPSFHTQQTTNILMIITMFITFLALLSGIWAPCLATTTSLIFLFAFDYYQVIQLQDSVWYPFLYLAIFGYSVCLATKLARYRVDHIKQRELLARSLVDHSLHPIILKQKDGTIISTSRSISLLTGRNSRELKGKNLHDYVYKEDKKRHKAFHKILAKNPGKRKKVDLRFHKKNGELIWLRNDAVNLLDHPHIKAIVSSLQDISEQKELDAIKEQILARENKARELAEKAVKERDEFISIASHELRTPLTNILLQLQSTLGQILNTSLADFSGPKLFKHITIAEQQSQRLSILIKDLLNVSLASTGMIAIKPEAVNLTDLIQGIVDRLDAQIRKHKTQIKLDLADSHTGYWDPIRLEQAITNLITNAVKYGQGKPVTITTSSNSKTTKIGVTDQGPGIKKKEQKHIFKLFHRCKETEKKQGLGIGLYITKKIVDAHGGKIILKSKQHKGTTFTIKLPNGEPPETDVTEPIQS